MCHSAKHGSEISVACYSKPSDWPQFCCVTMPVIQLEKRLMNELLETQMPDVRMDNKALGCPSSSTSTSKSTPAVFMMLRKSKDITRSYLYGSLYFHILDRFGSFQYFNTCEVNSFLYCIMKIKPFVRILTFFMT